MIEPPPWLSIRRAAATEPKKGPRRLLLTTSSKSSSVSSKTGPKRVRVALLTSTSRRPNRALTWSTSFSTADLEPMSAGNASASPPSYAPLTTTHSWGTFHPQDLTLALPLLTEIECALSAAGIRVQQFHSEAGQGQYEIVLAPLPAIDAIHTFYQARQIVQHIAEAADLRATFHPCPFPGTGNASNAHI